MSIPIRPHLSFINTQNYKNLMGQFNLTNLNIFIGSNGSGKSNLINCFKLLKDCLTPVADASRGVSSFEDAISKFGGDRILDNTMQSPAYVTFTYGFSSLTELSDNSQNSVILECQLSIDQKQHTVTINQELLSRPNSLIKTQTSTPFYYYQFHNKEVGKGVISVYDDMIKSTRFENLYNLNNRSLGLDNIPSLLETSSLSPEKTPVSRIRRELLGIIAKWQFYNANNMDLKEIRESEPKIGGSDIYLSTSGNNLALVIQNLSKDIDFEERLNEIVKSIIPQTRKIRAYPYGRLSLIIEWYLEGYQNPFFLTEMSDGTVRMLCWAVILHSPQLPSLIVIDEPELGLHVAWLKILAEWIKKASQKTQIIITTHSPDLLDHFTDCLENILCFHSNDNQHFSLKTFSEETLKARLEEGWELGDLYRVGDPNVGGWPW